MHFRSQRGQFRERRRDDTRGRDWLFDLKTRAVPLGENGEIVVGDAVNLAKHADDFVAIARLDQDDAQRGEPRVGRRIGLEVALRLHLDR